MNYYKVTQNNLKSVVIAGKYSVQYQIGEFSEPKMGGLLVFSNFKEARWFANKGKGDRIFKCECEEKIPLPPFRTLVWRGCKLFKKDLWVWERESEGEEYWPKSTHAFKKIKLVDEIKY